MIDEKEIIVPIEGLYNYANSNQWKPYCQLLKSRLYGAKKFKTRKERRRYKRAVKHLNKAAAFLPFDFVIEVKLEEGKNDE